MRSILLASIFVFFLLAFNGIGSLRAQTNTVSFQLKQVDGSPAVAPYNFHPARLMPGINWTADWIWLNPDEYPMYQRTKTIWLSPENQGTPYRVFFRKEMNWKPGTSPVYLYCTADVRFRLYINGILSAEGPVNTGGDYDDTKAPDYWYYSIYDISSFLKEGNNTIAVEVFSYALEWSEITSTYGGFLAEIKAGDQTILRTDASWQAIADTSLQKRETGWNGKLEMNPKDGPNLVLMLQNGQRQLCRKVFPKPACSGAIFLN